MKGTTGKLLRRLSWAGALLACAAAPALASNVDLFHRVHTTVPIRDLAHGASGYAAAGANGIWTSTDLTSWTQASVPAGMGLPYDAIVWSGSEYVAGGAGGIVTSPDGGTWTQVYANPATNLNIYSIVYAGGIYLAVGSDSNGAVALRSTDGQTWTPENTGLVNSGNTTYAAYGVAYGNGLYVVEAQSAEAGIGNWDVIVTSPDGIDWTQAPLPNGGTDEFFGDSYDGAYGNGTFVEGGFAGIYTSTDGVNWTGENFQGGGHVWIMVRIEFANGHFVAVGRDYDVYPSTLAAFVSTDGINWTATDLSARREPSLYEVASAVWNGSEYVAAGYDGVWTSSDTTAWSKVYDGPQSNGFLCLGHGGGNYLMVSDGGALPGNSLILHSTDGTSWPDTLADAGTDIGGGANPGCVAYGNNTFVAGGDGTSTDLYYSSSGNTWTAATVPANFYFGTVTWDGSHFLALGYSANDFSTTAAFASSDGATWTEIGTIALPVAATSNALRSINGNFFAWAYQPPLYASANGTNWFPLTLPPDFSRIVDVAFGRNRYIAVGSDTNGGLVIATSANGTVWNEETGIPANLSSEFADEIAFGGGEFVIPVIDRSTQLSAYLTSHDGLTWTETAQPGNWNLQTIAWDGTKFIASSYYDIFNAPGVELDLAGKVKAFRNGGAVHLRYTFRASNDSTDGTGAHGAMFTDPLPAGVAFESATASRGRCAASRGTVTCQLGDLAPGTAALVRVQVRVTRPACSISNTAEGYAAEPVRDDASPSATVTITRPHC